MGITTTGSMISLPMTMGKSCFARGPAVGTLVKALGSLEGLSKLAKGLDRLVKGPCKTVRLGCFGTIKEALSFRIITGCFGMSITLKLAAVFMAESPSRKSANP